MQTKDKTDPKERGLNSDEQKRVTNKPEPNLPDGTETKQQSEKDNKKTKKKGVLKNKAQKPNR